MKLLDSSKIQELLRAANIDIPPSHITPWGMGANNQVYRLRFEGRPDLALKQYREDQKERLTREFHFTRFAGDVGLTCVPQAFAALPSSNLALYSFIDGDFLKEAKKTHVNQALEFILQLNEHRSSAKNLIHAEESCFSLQDYHASCDRRIEKLLASPVQDPIDKEAYSFVKDQLCPIWQKVKSLSLIPYHLIEEERCLSPSDFGFHNALEKASTLTFIDFEYAGWDDPAKLVADFFLQPAIPAPLAEFESFAQGISTLSIDKGHFYRRLEVILEISKVRWCCIMLNVFKNERSTSIEKKRNQLFKAIKLINTTLTEFCKK